MIGETISHYRVIEKIGEGGMGVVYLAEHTLLRRRVAIKTLVVSGVENQHFRSRFLREAQAVSKLSHPNIATVYDYGETDGGQPYIVMELVEGQTLADLMGAEVLTIPRAIGIVKQVAEALAEAHRHGIVHRDIKPSNIAVNERGVVKVLDFGLAKHAPSSAVSTDATHSAAVHTQTREGVIVGTPLYLSPEQALGVEVDARSDLFSLGSVLYECIAGRPAFAGKSAIDICAKVIRDDPAPPSDFNNNVSANLDRITLKALSKKPEARFQTAAEMTAGLAAVGGAIDSNSSIPAVTRRVTSRPQTRSTTALATLSDLFRRPRLSIGYLIGALLIIAAVVLSIWLWKRPRLHVPPLEAIRLYDTGTAAIRNGSFFQATKALEQALHEDDEFVLAHARMAEALTELDYQDKAKDEMLRVSQLTPDRSILTSTDSLYLDAITATVRRDFGHAIDAYSNITSRLPNDSLVYVDLARAYEKDNQFAKAIETYTKATDKDPQNPTAFLRLGILDARQHKIPEANAALDKAESIYQSLGNVEGRAEVAFQRGVLLNDIAGKVEDAGKQLDAAREMAKVVHNQYQQIRILFQLSSVSFKLGKTDQAQQYAREAIDLAQANGMETLIARSYIELGYTYFIRADYANAERNFLQGLEFAQRFAARQNEARAQLSLASVYVQKGDADRALSYEEQALPFYQTGGYRTETSQAFTIRGRAFQLKGDYDSAFEAFRHQLEIAEQNGDQAQVAVLHNTIGYLLLDQEKYTDALQHFEKNYEIAQSSGNQLRIGYALMNRGATFWRVGQPDKARADLDQATSIANPNDNGNFKELLAYIDLLNAQIALGNRDFGSAENDAELALKINGEQNKIVLVRGTILVGLAQAQSGIVKPGVTNCRAAVDATTQLNDPLLLARARLGLAEALLMAGDGRSALSEARESQLFFDTAGLSESQWRALLIEGLASQKNGDRKHAQDFLIGAKELLLSLDQKWGSDVFMSYLNRRDIAEYRKKLDQNLATFTRG
ncbi:MAG TPA: tetratricopeptide repeat protein [Pyrinomonadaceae bacterium]|jgi:serine/threonine protein kinase/lipopolysaccharide biosynthesis regulator YciM|nr:tetratricopeptide repeat protein [Pyrinomonadaceae bacterium]